MAGAFAQGQAEDLSRDEFVSASTRIAYLSGGLAVLLIVVAALMWESNIWTAIISLIVAAAQFIISVTLPRRVRKRDQLRQAGNVVVQHSWLVLSIAVAALAIYPSPFFEVAMLWFAGGMLISILWAAIGAFNLYQSITRAGARLTI
jgi:cobalamin synthase